MGFSESSDVLILCTANQCRSPMAQAFLRLRLGERTGIDVVSAGFLTGGVACPPHVIAVMNEVGIDLSGHRSLRVGADLVDRAGIIVTMSRQHSIDLAAEFPSARTRCFTVAELEECTSAAGGPQDESLRAWSTRLSSGRQPSDLLRRRSDLDVPDPMGKSLKEFRRTRDRLEGFAIRLAALLAPERAPG